MLRRLGLVLVLCVVGQGCETTLPDASPNARVSKLYEEAVGRFRGRWWNHYERGRLFLDEEQWVEAERDFRVALARRATDGLWARTYGLHFLPEYFPHRELGVALYSQGRTGEAVDELERSLGDRHSARAAYYLGLARISQLKTDARDQAPPTFELIAPSGSSPVGATTAELRGIARDDTYVAAIRVDGEPVPVAVSAPQVEFSCPVRLAPGRNRFTVTVEDLLGKSSDHEVIVASDVDGPAVSFDTPVVVPGRVQGVAMDTGGVVAMRIAGLPATLVKQANGLMQFSMAIESPATIDTPLRYECEDTYGNVTTGTLPVDAVVLSEAFDRLGMTGFAAQRFVLLGDGLKAVFTGERLVAAMKAAADVPTLGAEPQVKILTPRAGQVYHEEEIVVDVEVRSANPLRTAQVDGTDVPLIPDRPVQSCSRRVRLEEPGTHPIKAVALDEQGKEASDTVEVERRLSAVEEVGRLDVAFLGYCWENENKALADGTDFSEVVVEWLQGELYESRRFAGIRERNPEALQALLAEQELSTALGDKDEILALHRLVPAEVLLIGKIHRYADSLEIVLEGKSTESFGAEDVLTVARADVSGPVQNTEQLRELVRVLSLRFLQEFPRVQGSVALVREDRLVTTLNELKDRVRPNMKLVVFRKGPPITDPADESIILEDGDTEILGEALVTIARQNTSDARIVVRSEPYQAELIERGNFVVTK